MDERPPLDAAELAPGTSALLVAVDPGSARELLHASLAGVGENAAVLAVTTDGTADAVDGLRARGIRPDAIGVVDASGAGASLSGVAEASTVEGPGALSSLGIAISDLLDRLDHRFDRVYVGLDSAGGVLAAAPLSATFRFLHVLCGRIRTSDAVLLATIDRPAHDEETLRTVSELFDGTIEVD